MPLAELVMHRMAEGKGGVCHMGFFVPSRNLMSFLCTVHTLFDDEDVFGAERDGRVSGNH